MHINIHTGIHISEIFFSEKCLGLNSVNKNLGPLYLDAWDAKIFTKKTKSPLFSQRKAAVGWRSWWCGNFLLLSEVYSEV